MQLTSELGSNQEDPECLIWEKKYLLWRGRTVQVVVCEMLFSKQSQRESLYHFKWLVNMQNIFKVNIWKIQHQRKAATLKFYIQRCVTTDVDRKNANLLNTD